jgi:putative ABC transport system permease protein
VFTLFSRFEATVPMEWAIIGLLFCSTVGITFGLLPAIRASRIHPIEALRHE